MADRYKLMEDKFIDYAGKRLYRVLWLADNREGGWMSKGAVLPQDGRAVLYGDVKIVGGTFWNGVFRGGEFWVGVFWGGEFYQSPCMAQRSDGYLFVAKVVDGELRVWAGCRNFSWDEAVTHWHDGHRLGAESQRIINFLKAQAEAEEARNKERV